MLFDFPFARIFLRNYNFLNGFALLVSQLFIAFAVNAKLKPLSFYLQTVQSSFIHAKLMTIQL